MRALFVSFFILEQQPYQAQVLMVALLFEMQEDLQQVLEYRKIMLDTERFFREQCWYHLYRYNNFMVLYETDSEANAIIVWW
ncbi:hypothetical protein KA405_06725 [Patescibacteria group bacterium]|nr:hypothetical protein [Patescibacteria group bacterium]